jgi:hypothetical protein
MEHRYGFAEDAPTGAVDPDGEKVPRFLGPLIVGAAAAMARDQDTKPDSRRPKSPSPPGGRGPGTNRQQQPATSHGGWYIKQGRVSGTIDCEDNC